MAIFDWAESDSSELEEQPRVHRQAFGDGYEQRMAAGINNIAQAWTLAFEGVDDPIGEDIMAFFRAHYGVLVFDWTPKWGTTAIKVVCSSWRRSIAGPGLCNIRAVFEQKFE